MKAILVAVFIFFSSTHSLWAQRANVNLLAQSPDGRTVKLMWLLKSWNSDITAFDIRRKEGLQDWVKLNSEPIVPGISAKKNLSVVESDKGEESRLKAKLYKLLRSHKLQETPGDTLLGRLNQNEGTARNIADMATQDYDLALISGFAYVDHSVTRKMNYEYGLFIAGTNELLDSVLWNYGQIPNLDVVHDVTSKATTKKNGVELMWDADAAKMKSCDAGGFNVYRDGIRMNLEPITSANNTDFSWYDKAANTSHPIQYSISAESIFGIEGVIRSYTYNPADHPNEYRKAEVKDITSLGYYFKEGISVKWSFPKEYEPFIKGFYVQKNNLPEGYKQASPLLDPSIHAYIDKTPSTVNGYISFRIITVYKDRSAVDGNGMIYTYFPMREPPPPLHLTAQSVTAEKNIKINLSWDAPMSGDTVTASYVVYCYNPSKDEFTQASEHAVRDHKYSYDLPHTPATMNRFYVTSVSKTGSESTLTSDTVAVTTPSLALPRPSINMITITGSNKAFVQWQYPLIRDLKGFRLFRNKEAIATLTADKNAVTTDELAPGTSYEFTLQAISENGVQSEVSQPYNITIPRK